MRRLLLTLAAALALGTFATAAMAGNDIGPIDDVPADDVLDDDGAPVVPEPTAALAMGAGLATIAFALRRRR